jgi:hypothetical protein
MEVIWGNRLKPGDYKYIGSFPHFRRSIAMNAPRNGPARGGLATCSDAPSTSPSRLISPNLCRWCGWLRWCGSARGIRRARKQSFSLPPHQYHLARRVDRAQELLRKGEMSITEVAMVFTSSFMIAGGVQIIVSRNLDSRATYVVGVSLLLGLAREVFPTYFKQATPVLHLFTGSMSIGVLSAFLLNLIFRIGATRSATFEFENADPCTYISASAVTSARSERWWRSNNSVENRPARSCGTRNSSLPTRVISVRP